ncbi:hypothetical protein HY213_02450 [Candidatus Peregrinibacteria bacterium]|nr:hypothetical protein [Candidatus Peregrinibacteria bacterium]
MALLHLLMEFKRKDCSTLLQDLGISDNDGRKSISLNSALKRATTALENHKQLRLADVSHAQRDAVFRILHSSEAHDWWQKAIGDRTFIEKALAQKVIAIDARITQLRFRKAVAQTLKPRITPEEHAKISESVSTSDAFEETVALCRSRYEASPVPNKDIDEAIAFIEQEPEEEEWKSMFLSMFLDHAIVEKKKSSPA